MTFSRVNRDLQLGDKKVTLNHLVYINSQEGSILSLQTLFSADVIKPTKSDLI